VTDAPARFVARTRRLPAPVDLLAAAGGDGLLHVQGGEGLAARGVAARLPASAATAWLQAVDVDDEVGVPGTGAVAFGALPFHPDPDADLLVPSVVWGRSGEDAWVTTISPPHQAPEVPEVPPAPLAVVTPPGATGSGPPTIRPARPPAWWQDLVARCTAHLRSQPEGGLSKVVLAREVLVEQAAPFDRAAVLARLRDRYPACFLFLVDGFLGASPELLVRRDGDRVRAQPMAGTAPRGATPEEDAALAEGLRASATYRHEHQITIDMVYDTLLPWCSYLDYEPEPSIVAVANVQHLASYVEGLLSDPAPSILELVAALHPTPAVSGWPRDLATAWIDAHEEIERGRYAGAVGWVDASGNGVWAVAIRCAQVDGGRARVIAGNGIVADSDPPTELAETEAKLAAMLGALTP
jgi:menaquinone-specific isochorismate synthase